MTKLRPQSLSWLLTLISTGSARTLFEVLQTNPDLSAIYNHINSSSNVTGILANANNFTFLAPSNDAIQNFIKSNPNNLTNDLLEATIQYSLLRGGFPLLSFSNASQFVSSSLINSSYTNVTAGQAVEIVSATNGTLQVVTGNRSVSTVKSADIVCIGGIIHIMNEVLTIPVTAVSEITSASLDFFVSILNIGGYLNSVNANYVNEILEVPDVTYFIPNSAAALANATALAKNSTSTELQAIFEYHVVPNFVGYSSLLGNGTNLKTKEGDNVTVTTHDGYIYINAARIIASDYIVANGVVHVIDNLLNRFDTSPPPQTTSQTTATSSVASSATASANATTSETVTSSGTPAPTSLSKSHSKSAIGIGIGVTLAGLLFLGAITWFLIRWKKQKKEAKAWDNQNISAVHQEKGFPLDGNRGDYMPRQQGGLQLGLGSQSDGTGMRSIRSMGLENVDGGSNNPAPGTYIIRHASTISRPSLPSGPSVPPRSPSRGVYRDEF